MTEVIYPIVVVPLREEEGGGFAAFVPDLPGCMGDGETAEDALRDACAAIKEWLSEATRLKRDIPAPFAHAARVREERKTLLNLLKRQHDTIHRVDELGEKIEELKDQIQEALARESQGVAPIFSWSADFFLGNGPPGLAKVLAKSH